MHLITHIVTCSEILIFHELANLRSLAFQESSCHSHHTNSHTKITFVFVCDAYRSTLSPTEDCMHFIRCIFCSQCVVHIATAIHVIILTPKAMQTQSSSLFNSARYYSCSWCCCILWIGSFGLWYEIAHFVSIFLFFYGVLHGFELWAFRWSRLLWENDYFVKTKRQSCEILRWK